MWARPFRGHVEHHSFACSVGVKIDLCATVRVCVCAPALGVSVCVHACCCVCACSCLLLCVCVPAHPCVKCRRWPYHHSRVILIHLPQSWEGATVVPPCSVPLSAHPATVQLIQFHMSELAVDLWCMTHHTSCLKAQCNFCPDKVIEGVHQGEPPQVCQRLV